MFAGGDKKPVGGRLTTSSLATSWLTPPRRGSTFARDVAKNALPRPEGEATYKITVGGIMDA
ncbi:hypothetical protein JCM10296v2_004906 [Rhodotorula toruloides]